MKFTSFQGDHFSVGVQQGRIYRENGMRMESIRINRKLHAQQLRAYLKFYPEFVEQVRGVAQGGDYDLERTLYRFLTSELFWFTTATAPAQGCTIFGITTDAGAFVGRNYDWLAQSEQFLETSQISIPDKNSYFAVSDMGVGSDFDMKKECLVYTNQDIINEKGLFIGINFAHANASGTGLSWMHLTKLIAETCETVGEALELLRTVPLCRPKNFFVADRHGNMAVVEHAVTQWAIIKPVDGVLIKTNHFLDPELARDDLVLIDKPTHNTFIRYYQVLQQLNRHKARFTRDRVPDVLLNTDTAVCQVTEKMKTIWSLCLDMKQQEYELYWGIPDKVVSRKISFSPKLEASARLATTNQPLQE